MQREGGFGQRGAAAPAEKGLSTEDIAQTETETKTPQTETGSKTQAETTQDRAQQQPARSGGPAGGPAAARDAEGAEPRTRTADTADTAGDKGKPEAASVERSTASDQSSREPEAEPLLESKRAEDLRSRWQEIQGGFVDDPQASVRAADGLVAEVMQLLATTFADHKQGLEGQWHRGEEVPTEDLRVALRQYRSFFVRLLST
jgi:hypothetical protein